MYIEGRDDKDLGKDKSVMFNKNSKVGYSICKSIINENHLLDIQFDSNNNNKQRAHYPLLY